MDSATRDANQRDTVGKAEFRGPSVFSAAVINSLQGIESAGQGENGFDSKPIADLFPYTTVMFADIVGFTAWSSVREPSQVFTLLESVFRSFDRLARRFNIFKVSNHVLGNRRYIQI